MMAASLLMLIPMIVIFLAGQRFFISGLTVGAVKAEFARMARASTNECSMKADMRSV
jgi:hypothetical protein